MASSLNRATLIGNVGKDPEFKDLNNGRIATLSIATSRSWNDRTTGERKEKTAWHRIVVRNDKLVEIVEKYVRKGSRLMVEGEISYREWEQDGQKKYMTEIDVSGFDGRIMLLDKRDATDEPARAQPARRETKPAAGGWDARPRGEFDSEIPF